MFTIESPKSFPSHPNVSFLPPKSIQVILTRPQIRKPINLLISTDTSIRAIFWNHQPIRIERNRRLADELIALDEDLVVGSGVDCLVEVIFVKVGVDVLVAAESLALVGAVVEEKKRALWNSSPKSPSRPSRPAISPVVVVIGDVQMAKVHLA